MRRLLIALAILLCSTGAWGQSVTQVWQTPNNPTTGAAGSVSCDGVLGVHRACALSFSATGATPLLDVSACQNWIAYALESTSAASDFTTTIQKCFRDNNSSECTDLHATPLDGDAAFYYNNQGPSVFIRANSTVTAACGALRDCQILVTCAK